MVWYETRFFEGVTLRILIILTCAVLNLGGGSPYWKENTKIYRILDSLIDSSVIFSIDSIHIGYVRINNVESSPSSSQSSSPPSQEQESESQWKDHHRIG